MDTTGYETLLQTLAESDGSGRREAPSASKIAISGPPTMEVRSEEEARTLLGIWEMRYGRGKLIKCVSFLKKI